MILCVYGSTLTMKTELYEKPDVYLLNAITRDQRFSPSGISMFTGTETLDLPRGVQSIRIRVKGKSEKDNTAGSHVENLFI